MQMRIPMICQGSSHQHQTKSPSTREAVFKRCLQFTKRIRRLYEFPTIRCSTFTSKSPSLSKSRDHHYITNQTHHNDRKVCDRCSAPTRDLAISTITVFTLMTKTKAKSRFKKTPYTRPILYRGYATKSLTRPKDEC